VWVVVGFGHVSTNGNRLRTLVALALSVRLGVSLSVGPAFPNRFPPASTCPFFNNPPPWSNWLPEPIPIQRDWGLSFLSEPNFILTPSLCMGTRRLFYWLAFFWRGLRGVFPRPYREGGRAFPAAHTVLTRAPGGTGPHPSRDSVVPILHQQWFIRYLGPCILGRFRFAFLNGSRLKRAGSVALLSRTACLRIRSLVGRFFLTLSRGP